LAVEPAYERQSLLSERSTLAVTSPMVGQIEDAILRIDLKDRVHFQHQTVNDLLQGRPIADSHAKLKDNIFVYKMGDFVSLHEQVRELGWATFYFNGHLRQPNEAGHVEEFRRLCSWPRIRQEISRLSAGCGSTGPDGI